jgi:hypothetical protein
VAAVEWKVSVRCADLPLVGRQLWLCLCNIALLILNLIGVRRGVTHMIGVAAGGR